jgi:hypothetical protein
LYGWVPHPFHGFIVERVGDREPQSAWLGEAPSARNQRKLQEIHLLWVVFRHFGKGSSIDGKFMLPAAWMPVDPSGVLAASKF